MSVTYIVTTYPGLEHNAYNKDDAGWFVVLARNMVDHGHYSVDTYLQENYGHHATWPPVFPSWLAGVMLVAGKSWIALRLSIVFLALVGLWAIYRALSAFETESTAHASALLVAVSPMYFLFAHVTMSEILMIVLSFGCLALIVRAAGVMGALAAGTVAAAAFLTRGYAIVLIPAGVAQIMLSTTHGSVRYRLLSAGAFTVPALVAVVGWYLYTEHIYHTYPLDTITSTFGTGASGGQSRERYDLPREFYWFHTRSVTHLFMPLLSHRSPMMDSVGLIAVPLLGVAAWGACRAWRRGNIALVVWTTAGLGLVLKMGQMSPRYWLTYLPVLFFFVLLGVGFEAKKRIAIGVFLAVLGSALIAQAHHLAEPDKLRYISGYWKSHSNLATQIDRYVPRDSLVFSHSPHNFYAATGIQARPLDDIDLIATKKLSNPGNIYVLCPAREDKLIPKLRLVVTEKCKAVRSRWPTEVLYKDENLALERVHWESEAK